MFENRTFSAFLLSGLHFHIYVIYVCPTCTSHQAILEAAMALGKASGPTAVRSNAFVKTIHNMCKFGQTFLIRFSDSKHIDCMTGAQHLRTWKRFGSVGGLTTYLAQEANAAKVFPPFVSEPRSISRDRWNQSWAIACLSTCGASVGFFSKQFTVGVLSAFLMGPPCLERCVRLSGLVFLLCPVLSPISLSLVLSPSLFPFVV